MKLLALYQNAELPSSRIRVLQMLPHLQDLGLEVSAQPYPRELGTLRQLIKDSTNYQVIYWQKKLPSSFDAWLWKSCSCPIIFDYDDAIMMRSSPKKASYHSGSRQAKFKRILKLSSGIVCGNSYLREQAENYPHSQLVLPSAVPYQVPQKTHQASEPLRLGWVGLGHNLRGFAPIESALRALAKQFSFQLVIFSNQNYQLQGVEVVNRPWSLTRQEAEIATWDLGIMPLALDSPYSRGKCAYKLLQYMAAGLPVVASKVGMNQEVVEEGQNGYLAADSSQWEEALAQLLRSTKLRDELGQKGRKRVVQGYSYPAVAEKLASFLKQYI